MGLINSGVAQVKGPTEYEGGKGFDNETTGVSFVVSVKPNAIERRRMQKKNANNCRAFVRCRKFVWESLRVTAFLSEISVANGDRSKHKGRVQVQVIYCLSLLLGQADVFLSGGMELLFDNERQHTVKIPAQSSSDPSQPAKLRDLIFYIRDNMMTEKKDLFVDKDTV